ncbi:MAG TPA: metalloregulator ArsR/SmtB family transcription factor [Actinomycetes bacterium]
MPPHGDRRADNRSETDALAQLLKAVADPARLQLPALIRAAENGESCVCDLAGALGLSQPTVSRPSKVLSESDILTREKRGTWAWYSVMPERLEQIAAVCR